jgi:hypothetical protein
MVFEVPFNTTNECYTSSIILNDDNINLEGQEMKYSEYINNTKYFDKTNYSFGTSELSNNAYKECKERTENLNSDFFLVSDISYHSNNFHYNCYIPKNSQKCNANTLDQLISPFEEVFKKMFDVDDDLFTTSSNINHIMTTGINPQISYDISYDKYSTIDICNNNCFINENQVLLPKTNYFGIFYSDFLDINSNDANMKSYFSSSIIEDISKIKNNYTEDKLNTILNELSNNLTNYICNTATDSPNIDAIDQSIKELDKFYNGYGDETDSEYNIGFIPSLVNLANDISNIGQYSRTNTRYLRAVDDLVKKSNSKLNNVLKLDGANNGKYNDTTFLKNQKISEIIILMLIIIFLIFIYSKKK